MPHQKLLPFAALLAALALPAQAADPPPESAPLSILQLKILEGDAAVHRAGLRSSDRISVQVTDQTGRPVDRAAVSFRLPENGPSGTFPNGLRTDVYMTGSDGIATAAGIRWNQNPGTVQVRITVGKDQAHAGLISSQYLSESVGRPRGEERKSGLGNKKLLIVLLVAGLAGGGVVGATMLNGGKSSSPAAIAPAASTAAQIGAPRITIGGHP